jgi:dienelactone hydrolase
MKRAAVALTLSGTLVLAGCAGVGEVALPSTTTGVAEQIPTTVHKPDGPGPFPAVVIAHDCSGLGPGSSGAPGRWARELVGRGYVVLLPDSFTTRGFPAGVCTDARPGRNDVSPPRRARDAHATLAYARTLPYVDGRRVGLMGGSHGGSTTLAAMLAADGDTGEQRAGFAAAVALYPACAPSGRTWHNASGVYRPAAPLLILIGEKDDWTPAPACRALADAAQRAGYPVSIKVYPGAHHSFDSPNPIRYVGSRINANAPGGRGATTGGDPDAWADSIREVAAFFARHLKGDESCGTSTSFGAWKNPPSSSWRPRPRR